MVTLTINNNFTHVDHPEFLREAIDRFYVIKQDGFVKGIDFAEYQATGKAVLKTKYKPETLNLYNWQRQVFPTGRLGYVIDWADSMGVSLNIIDNRQQPSRHLDVTYVGPLADGSNGAPARPYQLRAPQVLRDHGGRGIFWHATASGKTATASRIIADLGVRTLYVVPSIELLDQTAGALREFLQIKNGQVGTIGEGEWNPQQITVATVQTLWARYEKPECQQLLSSTECLIADESHHVNSKERGRITKSKGGKVYALNSWYIMAMNCPAYYRVGLTGTPGKDVEKKRAYLECSIGRCIDRVTARELIDAGIISDVEIHIHDIKYSITYSDFHTARKEGILLNEPFNEYIVQIALAELKLGRSVLILTDSKAHQGPLLVKLFAKQGLDVPFVCGDSVKGDRRNVREEFRKGNIRCLIGTVYREGVDFPALDTGILAGGGLDEKKPLQFMGRVLRKAKGKGIAHLHDFNLKDHKYLQRHSRQRLSYYLDEELDKIITHKGITI